MRLPDSAVAAAPFAVWMAMMMLLPSDAAAYALRTAVVAPLLVGCAWRFRPWRINGMSLLVGSLIGMLVFAVWVAPEDWFGTAVGDFYRRWCIFGGSATVRVSDSPPWMIALKLFGSAFVIAPAEELFFRFFLYRRLQSRDWRQIDWRRFDASAFWWTVALFALGHNRIVVGAAAGVLYGLTCIRGGLAASMAAHCVTNLALGWYVIRSGHWAFW